jgi:hypothetical protein
LTSGIDRFVWDEEIYSVSVTMQVNEKKYAALPRTFLNLNQWSLSVYTDTNSIKFTILKNNKFYLDLGRINPKLIIRPPSYPKNN